MTVPRQVSIYSSMFDTLKFFYGYEKDAHKIIHVLPHWFGLLDSVLIIGPYALIRLSIS